MVQDPEQNGAEQEDADDRNESGLVSGRVDVFDNIDFLVHSVSWLCSLGCGFFPYGNFCKKVFKGGSLLFNSAVANTIYIISLHVCYR